MSEIQRDDIQRTREMFSGAVASDADRDAKIEQLLLVGLDHYFSARYEAAINVWTRALFLDRSHARARAYIERARSAVAERQRESEALLHDGVAAFHRGEGDEARRLLQAAIEGGAPSDEALAVLGRLDRLELPVAPVEIDGDLSPDVRRAGRRLRRDRQTVRDRASVGWVITTAALVVLVAWGGYAASASGVDWRSVLLFNDPPVTNASSPVTDLSLPLPRRGEVALDRARALAAGGHLHEALTALEEIRATDSQKADADRLRGDIQRQLIALTAMPPTPPPAAAPSDRRLP
jgi:tetratricopeptide (TPR) repeat protein